jgi:hypothetical protein
MVSQSQGLIDSDTWSLWKSGIEAALSKTAFQQAWKIIEKDTSFGPDFQAFVDKSIQTTS